MSEERGIHENKCVRQFSARHAMVSLSESRGGKTHPVRELVPLSRLWNMLLSKVPRGIN